jgi:hypothetical protein
MIDGNTMTIRDEISKIAPILLTNSTIDEIAATFLGLPPILNRCVTINIQTYLFEDGRWIAAHPQHLEDLVRLLMCKCSFPIGARGATAQIDTPTWRVRSVVSAIQAHTRAPAGTNLPVWVGPGRPPFNPSYAITAQDGVYDLSTATWHPSSPHWLDPVTLPATRSEIEGAPDPTTFRACLTAWSDGDPEWPELLLRVSSYLMMPYRDLQRAFLMVGKRRAGKGVWSRFIRRTVDPSNIYSTDMEKFAYTHGLEGADTARIILVNEVGETEVSVPAQMRRKLNEIIGRDETRLNPKGTRTYGAVLPGAVLMVGNDLPDIEDPSDSFWSKVIIVPYQVSFLDREDYTLEDRLWAERAAIYRLILEAGTRLLTDKRFPKVRASEAPRAALKRYNSPIDAFIDDRCKLNTRISCTKDELFGAFQSWCSFYDIPEMPRNTFFRKLHSSTHPIRIVKKGPKGAQTIHVVGIGLDPHRDQSSD